MIRLALFEPDMPGNFGAALRLAACLGVAVDVVEPLGFPLDHRRLRRAGMDYLDHVELVRHASFAAFEARRRAEGRRLVLLSRAADTAYHRFRFEADDVILVGRESGGAPPEVWNAADAALRIPMAPGVRSLNVVNAAAIVLAEALRQGDRWPG